MLIQDIKCGIRVLLL